MRRSYLGGLESQRRRVVLREEIDVWAKHHEPVYHESDQPFWMGRVWASVRHLSPGRGDDTLRKISHGYRVLVREVDANLLLCFPECSGAVIPVVWILSTAGKGDVTLPSVSLSRRALDEQNLRIAMPHPVLRPEAVQPVGHRLGIALPSPRLLWRPVSVVRLNANDECHGGSLAEPWRIRDVRVWVL